MTTTISSPLLDAIKQAVANHLIGAHERPRSLDAQTQVSTVLDVIDDAVEEFGAEIIGGPDAEPFAVGSRVLLAGEEHAADAPGTVTKRLEAEGQLHTIGVRWPGRPAVELYSPGELAEVP